MAGRPWHEPTDKSRAQVKALAAVGTRYEDIALVLDISADTLTRHYKRELQLGRVEANARMAQTLYQRGVDGNMTAAIFWLKTRAGWREADLMPDAGPEPDGFEVVPYDDESPT